MILILGGTTEAIKTAEALLTDKQDFIMTVTTDYGLQSFSARFKEKVKKVAFTEETLTRFIQEHGIKDVFDCTHPYATVISEIARSVCKSMELPYTALNRSTEKLITSRDSVMCIRDFKEAVTIILHNDFRRVLLTIGSKYLCEFKDIQDREAFARILPTSDSIEKCLAAGIAPSRIIAMQGPFSLELNIALINQFQIQCLVTKNSGQAGGFAEKIKACKQTGITALVIELA